MQESKTLRATHKEEKVVWTGVCGHKVFTSQQCHGILEASITKAWVIRLSSVLYIHYSSSLQKHSKKLHPEALRTLSTPNLTKRLPKEEKKKVNSLVARSPVQPTTLHINTRQRPHTRHNLFSPSWAFTKRDLDMSAVKSACAVYETHKEKQCILRQCLGALHNIQRREQQQTAELCMAKIDRSFPKHFPARILSKHCLLSPFEWPGRINWPASTECDLVYTPVPASKACLYKGFRTTLDAVRCRRRCNVHSSNSHQLYWQSTSWLFAAILMIPAKYFCLPAACKNKGYINSANVIARRWQTHSSKAK